MGIFLPRRTRINIWRFLVFFCIIAINADTARAHSKTRTVSIPGLGVLSGSYNTHDPEVTNFLGIPYAKPPIGDLRFLLPQPIYWNGTLDAHRKPPACVQPGSCSPSMSEDCLYLNVYVPGNLTDQSVNRSVMVWIHGGDFTSGCADNYNVKTLLEKGDVIVVTINYRLNIFGFLTAGDPAHKGNVGLHDQVMALKWVKENISPFGGDPEKITIFGQSAGAVSIYALLASPQITDGLFSRAIMQSGLIPPVTEPIPAFRSIAKLTSCPHIHTHGGTHGSAILNQIKCMRNKTTQELLAVATDPQAPKFGPVIDGVFLKSSIPEQLATSKSDVPCLIGINNQEFSLNANDSITDLDALKKRLASMGTQKFDATTVQYILSKFLADDLERAYTDALNSQMLVAHQDLTMTLSGTKDVFMYYFTHHPSFSKTNGAGNSEELPFVFGDMASATPDEKILSEDIIQIWSSFARDGVPQLPNGVKWPPYEKTNRTYVELNVNITADNVKQRLREGDRIFWNELMPKLMKMNANPQNPPMNNMVMTTAGNMHHNHMNMDMSSKSIAWGMSDQAVRDLLLSLLIIAIFLFVICLTLITILCKVRTIRMHTAKQNGALESATDGGNDNKAFTNDTKSKPESITAL